MTSKTIIAELRSLLATGFWEWDVRGASHLPPGAWLRRTASTSTPLDVFSPADVHPLLALSVYRGRFDAHSLRESFSKIAEANSRFVSALGYWSEALGITRGEAAQWFYVFTPPLGRIPFEAQALADKLDARRDDVWAALGLNPKELSWMLDEAIHRSDWPDPVIRPRFWTEEVKLK